MNGFAKGIGDAVRVEDPLGFPYEFSTTCSTSSVWPGADDLYTPGALVRLDHFNQITPDVPRAVEYIQGWAFA